MAGVDSTAAVTANNSSNKNKNDKKKTERSAKGSIEPVNKPEEKTYKEQIEKETKAIDEIKTKINGLQVKISSVAGGKEEYNRKKSEVRSRLDELQHQIDSLETQKKTLMTTIDSKKKEGMEAKQSVDRMKKSLGFSTAEEIDKKIEILERNLITNTLDLKEEKEILQQIKQLKNSKPLVGKIASLEKNTQSPDTAVAGMKADLDMIREKLVEIRTIKKEINEKYRELIDQRQQATAPVRDLIEERDKLSKEMNEHFAQRRAFQDKWNEEMWKYNNYLSQQRAERNERLREERQRRQADQERLSLQKELEKTESLPMEEEVALLSQTLAYVQKLVDSEHNNNDKREIDDTKENKKPIPQGEGLTLLPKNQREEEYFYAPVLKKKNEKKHKKEKARVLTHDIGTLSYFEQCGVPAPVSVDDLTTCLKQLQEKLEEHKQLQQAKASEAEQRKLQIQAQLDALDALA